LPWFYPRNPFFLYWLLLSLRLRVCTRERLAALGGFFEKGKGGCPVARCRQFGLSLLKEQGGKGRELIAALVAALLSLMVTRVAASPLEV
jgi:hypothetical protein